MKKRITGIDTPFGGLSWETVNSEKEVANRVIRFLEDKRVLYDHLYVIIIIFASNPF